MKIWARLIQNQKITNDVVREFSSARPSCMEGWREIIIELVKPLDAACPVMLQKHIRELSRFGRTGFLPADFMESVDFDKLEIEIFPEKKKNSELFE